MKKEIKIYEYISLKEIHENPEMRKYYKNFGVAPIITDEMWDQPIKYKWAEAEGYRRAFSFRVFQELRWAEANSKDIDSPLACLFEPTPRKIFQNVIMVDFYFDAPTGVDCLNRKLGEKMSQRICRDCEEKNLIKRIRNPSHQSTKMVLPTAKFVQAFEHRLAQSYLALVEMSLQLEKELQFFQALLKEIKSFEQLRKKYLPEEAFKYVSFDTMNNVEAGQFESKIHNDYLPDHKNIIELKLSSV